MQVRSMLAAIVVFAVAVSLFAFPAADATAAAESSKPPRGKGKGKAPKPPRVDTKDIQRCLHRKGSKRKVSCLKRLPKKRAKRVDVKDCLRSKPRLQCLQRLLIAPPRREPVVNSYPALPASITQAQFPDFSHDGRRIIAAVQSSEFSGTQIASFNKDGSDLRCLTCAVWSGAPLLKPFSFSDGRRILVRIGQQAAISPADHGVVECQPSVSDCTSATVVPINAPAAGDPNVVQDQREFRIAPDGSHVAFTQVRETATGHQTGIGVVGRLVRSGAAYDVVDARVVAVGGELKTISPDGKGIYFTRFYGAFDANNADDVYVPLRRGGQLRATFAPDWDEDVGRSPAPYRHRGWIVVGSGRGTGQIETLGRLRRPLAIEHGTTALNFAAFGGPEDSEPWLVDEYEARRDYIGQPLAPGAIASGWDSRPNFNWSPRGNEVVYWQRTLDAGATRVVVSRLKSRKAIKLHKAPRTPDPTWAPPLAGFVPPDQAVPQSRPGRLSGHLTVNLVPSPDPGFTWLLEVRYSNFSDSRGIVLNGTERSLYIDPGPLGSLYGAPGRFSADVVLSGRQSGYLRASDVGFATTQLDGAIESSVDGRRLVFGPID
jgi:hypothetical protein